MVTDHQTQPAEEDSREKVLVFGQDDEPLTNLRFSIDLIAYERRKGDIALLATCNPAAPNLGLPSTLLLPNFAC